MQYLAAFQKKIAIAPPAIPAIAEDNTNMPLSVLLGGLTAGRTPNFRIRTTQVSEKV
jgi:hypothetical protein